MMSRGHRTFASSLFCPFLLLLASGPSTNTKHKLATARAQNSVITCFQHRELLVRSLQEGENTVAPPLAPTSTTALIRAWVAGAENLQSGGLLKYPPESRRCISDLQPHMFESIVWSQNLDVGHCVAC